MMRPDFEKVLTQDVKDSPPWFGGVLEPLNRLFEYIKEAFNSNISVINLKAQVIEFQSAGLVGFPPVYPLLVVKKTRKGNIVSITVAKMTRANGDVWDSLSTVVWHEDGENIFIDNVQGVAGALLNIRLLALYE